MAYYKYVVEATDGCQFEYAFQDAAEKLAKDEGWKAFRYTFDKWGRRDGRLEIWPNKEKPYSPPPRY